MGKAELHHTKKRRASSGASGGSKGGGKKQAKGRPKSSNSAANGKPSWPRSERPKRSSAWDDAPPADASDGGSDGGGSGEDSEAEEAYELRPRRLPRPAKEQARPRAEALPIKTAAGELVYPDKAAPLTLQALQVEGVQIEEMPEPEASPVVSDDEPEQAAAAAGADAEEAEEEESEGEDALEGLQEFQLSEERRAALREQIAVAATQVLAQPEERLASLRHLLGFASHPDAQVARLALLSLVAVFKDLLPGYRIRLPTEKELAMQVSKDVKRVRDHEAALLKHYQAYLKGALAVAQGKRGMALAVTAVKCLCSLLAQRFTFNYASDLLQAVVPRMAHRSPAISQLCCDAVRTVLEQDTGGEAAKEACQLVADLVKARKCACPPAVVRTLLALRLREAEAAAVRVTAGEARPRGRKLSKRKKRKRDEVAADFAEAESKLDAASLRQQQADTLEVLFEIFFRVLKQAAASGLAAPDWQGPPASDARAAAKFPLLPPALAGLVRFSHMLSVEYFADILKVLLQLIRAPGLPLRLRLECLLAASDTHRAQGEALTVDRASLYEAFFELLLPVPLAPLLEQPEPQAASAAPAAEAAAPQAAERDAPGGSSQAERRELGALLTRIAVQMLLDQARGMQAGRLAAFLRRICGVCLQLEPGAAMGLLAVADRLLRRNQKLRWLLDNEGGPLPPAAAAEAEGLEAAAEACKGGTLWELGLLRAHAHPHIAQAAASILAIPLDGSAGLSHPVLSTPEGPEGVAAKYARMLFPPALQRGKKQPPRQGKRPVGCTPDFTAAAVAPDEAAAAELTEDPRLLPRR